MTYLLSPKYAEAVSWAADLHKNQKRKGSNSPYIAHLLGVSAIVIEFGGSEDEAIAGLLHDAVEDQGGKSTRAAIAQRFGEAVAVIVDGCTDDSPDEGEQKRVWQIRKDEYLAHLKTETSASILLVSASDKLYNASAILADYYLTGNAVYDRFTPKREGTLWYYREIVKALNIAWNKVADSTHDSKPGIGQLIAKLDKIVSTLESESV